MKRNVLIVIVSFKRSVMITGELRRDPTVKLSKTIKNLRSGNL
ncbi:hypothetical protein ES708_22539 [subsurface metagenome]